MEPMLSLPRLESTNLHTLVIRLGAAKNGTLPSSCSRALYAQVLEWFRQGDPAVSKAIHDSQESYLSLSALRSHHHKLEVKAGDEVFFRIGLLNGDLIAPLLSGLEKTGNHLFDLAKFPFLIRSIDMLPGTDPRVAASDYASLASSPIVQSDLTLKFLSPTNFKLNAGQGIQPFPLPEAVFGNLYRRWNAFAPVELKFPRIQWHGFVADYDLKTEKLKIENSLEPGATGWVRYQFRDPEQARIALILAQFAFFSGVGRQTAMGMGQVILDRENRTSTMSRGDDKVKRGLKHWAVCQNC